MSDQDKGKVHVHDERRHDFYMVDNVLVQEYGEHIGAYAIAVYNVLACRAGEKRVAWPSYRLIAKESGSSRSTAMRAIQVLEHWRIIRIEKRPPDKDDDEKEHDSNLYFLTDCSTWKPAPKSKPKVSRRRQGSISQTPGSIEGAPGVVSILNGGSAPQIPEQDEGKQNKSNNTKNVVVASSNLSNLVAEIL